jgi:hypothetical protein
MVFGIVCCHKNLHKVTLKLKKTKEQKPCVERWLNFRRKYDQSDLWVQFMGGLKIPNFPNCNDPKSKIPERRVPTAEKI